jgi:hypothetical protein
MTTYAFEQPTLFLQDFGVTAIAGAQTATVILSEPATDLLGNEIASNQYEIGFITATLVLAHGTVLTIGARTFKVLQSYLWDDGVFSRARLET